MIGALIAFALNVTGSHLVTAPTDSLAKQPDLDRIAKEHGVQIDRQVAYDLCLPATPAEYVALGKNAIVRLEASSVAPGELPLRSVYVLHNGIRTRLELITAIDPYQDTVKRRTVQVSFYLLPLQLRRLDGRLETDFKGHEGFVITTFAANRKIGPGAPAFVLRDPHAAPGKFDPATVIAVMKREYPDDMR